jgi:hypothetical protein
VVEMMVLLVTLVMARDTLYVKLATNHKGQMMRATRMVRAWLQTAGGAPRLLS